MPAIDQWIFANCQVGQTSFGGPQTYSRSAGITGDEEQELQRLTFIPPAESQAGLIICHGIARLATGARRWCFFMATNTARDTQGRATAIRNHESKPSAFAHAFLVPDKAGVPDLPLPPWLYLLSPSFRAPLTKNETLASAVPAPLPKVSNLTVEPLRADDPIVWLRRQLADRQSQAADLLASTVDQRVPASALIVGEAADVRLAYALLWELASPPLRANWLSVCTQQPPENHSSFSLVGWPQQWGQPATAFRARFRSAFGWGLEGKRARTPSPSYALALEALISGVELATLQAAATAAAAPPSLANVPTDNPHEPAPEPAQPEGLGLARDAKPPTTPNELEPTLATSSPIDSISSIKEPTVPDTLGRLLVSVERALRPISTAQAAIPTSPLPSLTYAKDETLDVPTWMRSRSRTRPTVPLPDDLPSPTKPTSTTSDAKPVLNRDDIIGISVVILLAVLLCWGIYGTVVWVGHQLGLGGTTVTSATASPARQPATEAQTAVVPAITVAVVKPVQTLPPDFIGPPAPLSLVPQGVPPMLARPISTQTPPPAPTTAAPAATATALTKSVSPTAADKTAAMIQALQSDNSLVHVQEARTLLADLKSMPGTHNTEAQTDLSIAITKATARATQVAEPIVESLCNPGKGSPSVTRDIEALDTGSPLKQQMQVAKAIVYRLEHRQYLQAIKLCWGVADPQEAPAESWRAWNGSPPDYLKPITDFVKAATGTSLYNLRGSPFSNATVGTSGTRVLPADILVLSKFLIRSSWYEGPHTDTMNEPLQNAILQAQAERKLTPIDGRVSPALLKLAKAPPRAKEVSPPRAQLVEPPAR